MYEQSRRRVNKREKGLPATVRRRGLERKWVLFFPLKLEDNKGYNLLMIGI